MKYTPPKLTEEEALEKARKGREGAGKEDRGGEVG